MNVSEIHVSFCGVHKHVVFVVILGNRPQLFSNSKSRETSTNSNFQTDGKHVNIIFLYDLRAEFADASSKKILEFQHSNDLALRKTMNTLIQAKQFFFCSRPLPCRPQAKL